MKKALAFLGVLALVTLGSVILLLAAGFWIGAILTAIYRVFA